jgi:hypothetical protein
LRDSLQNVVREGDGKTEILGFEVRWPRLPSPFLGHDSPKFQIHRPHRFSSYYYSSKASLSSSLGGEGRGGGNFLGLNGLLLDPGFSKGKAKASKSRGRESRGRHTPCCRCNERLQDPNEAKATSRTSLDSFQTTTREARSVTITAARTCTRAEFGLSVGTIPAKARERTLSSVEVAKAIIVTRFRSAATYPSVHASVSTWED